MNEPTEPHIDDRRPGDLSTAQTITLSGVEFVRVGLIETRVNELLENAVRDETIKAIGKISDFLASLRKGGGK